MHDESTDSNTDTSADNTHTTTNTEAATNAENSESGRDETIPLALDTALTASTVSNRDSRSLPGELLSKHTLCFRNTGKGKSKWVAGADTK